MSPGDIQQGQLNTKARMRSIGVGRQAGISLMSSVAKVRYVEKPEIKP